MIEVGAYSHIFEKFVNFIGVRSLIITDIDSAKEFPVLDNDNKPKLNKNDEPKTELKKCRVSDGTHTTNASLGFFYNTNSLAFYSSLKITQKTLTKKAAAAWSQCDQGELLCTYQTPEKNSLDEEYHARSFEDAFFHINKDFIKNLAFDQNNKFTGKTKLPSLVQKHLKDFANSTTDAYTCAENAIGSKPSFAMEVLLNSTTHDLTIPNTQTGATTTIAIEFSNWNTPSYIKEALKWLKQD
jgi:hypothetical protein